MKEYKPNSINYFNRSFDYLVSNYTDSHVRNQYDFIDMLISYIHGIKNNEHLDIDRTRRHIMNLPENFIYSIMSPRINDFYLDRTMKLLSKDKKLLEAHVASFLDKKIPLDSLNPTGDYSVDMSKNIALTIESYVSHLFGDKYCISSEMKEMRQKYIDGNFDPSYIAKLSSCIYEFNNCQLKNCYNTFLNRMKKDYSILINSALKNYSKFVKVSDSDVAPLESAENINFDDLDLDTDSPISSAYAPKYEEKTITFIPYSGKNFYTDNEVNNANLFIYTDLLPSLTSSSVFLSVHPHLVKQNEQAKRVLNTIFYNSFINKSFRTDPNYKQGLCKRIKHIAEFLHNFNLLQHYNSTNNSRIDKIGIPELKFDYDELFNDLTDLNRLYNYSQEALLGMSAFYSNRSSKTASDFCKAIFIINKLNIFDEIYNNDDFSLKDINLPKDKLKEYMAQYDLLTEDMKSYFRNHSDDKISEIVVDFSEESRADDYYKLYHLNKAGYEKKFPDQYDDDFDFITFHSCNLQNFLYLLKTQSIQSLVYTALKDNKKNIINWGYINENDNPNANSNMILIGFDIQTLNMPIKFHIYKDDLLEIVKHITGSTTIPYYIGGNDLRGTHSGDLTTQVVDVVSKDKKKAILKNNRRSLFFDHIKWMQRPNEKPDFLKNIPEKFYDLAEHNVDKDLDDDE